LLTAERDLRANLVGEVIKSNWMFDLLLAALARRASCLVIAPLDLDQASIVC